MTATRISQRRGVRVCCVIYFSLEEIGIWMSKTALAIKPNPNLL
jgi:hypothetical protein